MENIYVIPSIIELIEYWCGKCWNWNEKYVNKNSKTFLDQKFVWLGMKKEEKKSILWKFQHVWICEGFGIKLITFVSVTVTDSWNILDLIFGWVNQSSGNWFSFHFKFGLFEWIFPSVSWYFRLTMNFKKSERKSRIKNQDLDKYFREIANGKKYNTILETDNFHNFFSFIWKEQHPWSIIGRCGNLDSMILFIISWYLINFDKT